MWLLVGAGSSMTMHTSIIVPFPHQVSAVYEDILPCRSLWIPFSNNSDASMSIMAGFLIKEQIIRGEVERCTNENIIKNGACA